MVALVVGTLLRSVGSMADLTRHADRLSRPHIRATPSAGGIAILLAVVVGLGLAGAGIPAVAAVAMVGAFLLGLTADVVGLPSWVELVVQAGLGAVLLVGGLVVGGVPGPTFLRWLVTLVVFVGIVNAVGLADGVDGEAVGLVALAGLGLAIVTTRFGLQEMLALVIAGAALGFLGVNAPPAAVYLGANGTMLLGAGLAVVTISVGHQAAPFLAALMCLGVLAVELVLALIRRVLGRHPGVGGDHLSDQLIARGMTQRSVLVLTYVLQGVFIALAAVMEELFSGQAAAIFGSIWMMVILMLFAGGFVSYRVDA